MDENINVQSEDEVKNYEAKNDEVKNYKVKKEVISWLIYIFIAIIFSIFLIKFVVQKTQVSGMSMYKTLNNNDHLLMDKISYKFHDPRRFDIIVFPVTQDKNATAIDKILSVQTEGEIDFIKRIIGLPGEKIQIKNSHIYINGKKIKDKYGYGKNFQSGIAKREIRIPNDSYFVMGDNRNNSLDSRWKEVGFIKKSNITGKAFFRIYPNFGFLK